MNMQFELHKLQMNRTERNWTKLNSTQSSAAMNLKIVSTIYVTLSNRKRYLLYKIEIETLKRSHSCAWTFHFNADEWHERDAMRDRERERWSKGRGNILNQLKNLALNSASSTKWICIASNLLKNWNAIERHERLLQ